MRHPLQDPPKRYDFDGLKEIVDILNGPAGCPWDREQSLESLRKYLLEESYEVIEAMTTVAESDTPTAQAPILARELGDLLFQIFFVSQRQEPHFTIHDVVAHCCEKMVRRHPHVFRQDKQPPTGHTQPKPLSISSDQVVTQWTQIKIKEGDRSILGGVPRSMPALTRAFRLTEKAASVGFDWQKIASVLTKFDEECGEFKRALTDPNRSLAAIEEEMGDILFVLVNVARHLKIDPEAALNRTNRKFIDRFQYIERAFQRDGKSLSAHHIDKMEALWETAKTSTPPKTP